MYAKVTNSQNGYILAVCDSDIFGKLFSEGDTQLDLTSEFYKGEEKSDGEIADLMRNAHILNLVGEKSCALAVKEGLINDNDLKTVDGIPHVQTIMGE